MEDMTCYNPLTSNHHYNRVLPGVLTDVTTIIENEMIV